MVICALFISWNCKDKSYELIIYNIITSKGKTKKQLLVRPRTPLLSSLSARPFHIFLLRSEAHHSPVPIFSFAEISSPEPSSRSPSDSEVPIACFLSRYHLPFVSVSSFWNIVRLLPPHSFSRFCTKHLKPLFHLRQVTLRKFHLQTI